MLRPLVLVVALTGTACGGTADPQGLSSPGGTASAAEIAPDEVVATWPGGEVTYAELDALVGGDLRMKDIQHLTERHETKTQALESIVVDRLLQAKAEEQGFDDIEAFLMAEIEGKIGEPTPEEISEFYQQVAPQLGGMSLEEAAPLIAGEVSRQKQIAYYRDYITDLKGEVGVEVLLPPPDLPRIEVPVSADDAALGPADAPVTIVQFAEYQCGFCARVAPTLDRILEEYDGQVRIVFKDFPLENHDRAIPAAVAARCAGDQGQYWEMNSLLLENQQALGDADFLRYGEQIGLDPDTFETCLASGDHVAAVLADLEQGREAGVSATPSFLVNGIFLAGAQPYERFSAVIDEELAAAR